MKKFDYWNLVALLIAVVSFTTGVISSYILHRESDYHFNHPTRQEARLNEDISYKFYNINDETAVSEINGEPILEFLNKNDK